MVSEESSKSYEHILKYTSIFGGVQGLNVLIGLVRNKIIAVLLGPGGMGLASLFNTTVSFVSQSTNLGISFSAVKHVSELFDQGDEARVAHYIRVVRAWSLLTGLIGMLVCIAIGPLLNNYTFSWGDHTLHFVMLAPAVGLLAITGGETAILKGARRLRSLAVIQVYSVIAALIISIPLYYFFGETGIVPAIVLMAFSSMLLTVWYSYRLYPLKNSFGRKVLGEGVDMVKLGVAFTLAQIAGTSAEMFIRSYMNVIGNLEDVGLYNVGYMISVAYASLIFSAMETDYFPRLSAVNSDVEATSLTANKQIEVSLLMISPMLVMLIVGLPLLVPLLFSAKFVPVVPMAKLAALAMYMKVITLPVAYITLARGSSRSYLFLETSYYVVLVLLIIFGYSHWGIIGTGAALVLAHVFDLLLIWTYAVIVYHYRISATVVRYAVVQTLLGVATYLLTTSLPHTNWLYWVGGTLLFILSFGYSFCIIRSKTSLWHSLRNKFLNKQS